MRMRWFFVFFFFSGFCSLLYEVIWLRLGMAHFGVTTPVVSIFLSLFMAGLGLGSWIAGRWMRNADTYSASLPLRLYGLCELVIGISAWVTPIEMGWARSYLENYAGDLSASSLHFQWIAGLWMVLILLPWCAAMGMTIPLAMAAIRKLSPATQSSFSFLYVANVLGSVLGAMLPAFALVEIFGFRTTMKLAAVCNLGIAVAALVLRLHIEGQPALEKPAGENPATKPEESSPEKLILPMLFFTGLISLAMEVVWIRQFTPFVGTEVYGFATILGSYLTGTFIGSRIYRKWLQRYAPGDETGAWLLLGVAGLLPLLSADPRIHISGFVRVPLGVLCISGLMGFVTPKLVDHYSAGDPDRAGRAYAINVVGCILGPLISGFLLLPYLGERTSLILLCLPLFSLFYIFRPRAAAAKSRYGLFFYAEMTAIALALILATRDYTSRLTSGLVRRDYAATVVAVGQGMQRYLFVNGVTITQLTPVTKMMAHLPLAWHEGPPKDALVICFGMGTTHRSMLTWGVSSTAVELLPSVPQVFSFFHADGGRVLNDPNSHLVIDDGRLFLEKSRRQFDVITIDPPPPTSAAGVSLLYSTEFYEAARRRLKPGGILLQWTTSMNAQWSATTDPRVSLVAIAKALKKTFPYVRCLGSVEGWGYQFVASMSPLPEMTFSEMARRMPPAAVADMLEWGPARTPEQQFALMFKNEIPMERILAFNEIHVPALDDDRPVNEYYLLRAKLPASWSRALYAMADRE